MPWSPGNNGTSAGTIEHQSAAGPRTESSYVSTTAPTLVRVILTRMDWPTETVISDDSNSMTGRATPSVLPSC